MCSAYFRRREKNESHFTVGSVLLSTSEVILKNRSPYFRRKQKHSRREDETDYEDEEEMEMDEEGEQQQKMRK